MSRLQRWAVILSEYDYSIEHIKGSSNVIADCLSRLPMKLSASQEEFVINAVSENARDPCQSIPVSAADVSVASKSDREIASVMQFVQYGWPSNINESLVPYHRCRDELTLEAGCLVRGYRTVIPAALQQTVLRDLHAVHVGVVRMKGVARSFFLVAWN